MKTTFKRIANDLSLIQIDILFPFLLAGDYDASGNQIPWGDLSGVM